MQVLNQVTCNNKTNCESNTVKYNNFFSQATSCDNVVIEDTCAGNEHNIQDCLDLLDATYINVS